MKTAYIIAGLIILASIILLIFSDFWLHYEGMREIDRRFTTLEERVTYLETALEAKEQ